MPSPKQTPWLRNSCHMFRVKDAVMSDNVSKKTPVSRVTLVPKRLVDQVETGEISIATATDSPPTMA